MSKLKLIAVTSSLLAVTSVVALASEFALLLLPFIGLVGIGLVKSHQASE